MTEQAPQSFEEYNTRIQQNTVIDGVGMDTTVSIPCFFCAAPGFVSWKVMDMEKTASVPHTCHACGRSAKLIFTREGNPESISFEVVQTGGPDQPDWLIPKMRRI